MALKINGHKFDLVNDESSIVLLGNDSFYFDDSFMEEKRTKNNFYIGIPNKKKAKNFLPLSALTKLKSNEKNSLGELLVDILLSKLGDYHCFIVHLVGIDDVSIETVVNFFAQYHSSNIKFFIFLHIPVESLGGYNVNAKIKTLKLYSDPFIHNQFIINPPK